MCVTSDKKMLEIFALAVDLNSSSRFGNHTLSSLTFCIQETPKRVLLQTASTWGFKGVIYAKFMR